MGRATKEINKITGAIISTSVKLIVYSIVILLLYEGVTKGYNFGHEIFYSTSVAAPPGVDKEIQIGEGSTVTETANMLVKKGLIKNPYVFAIQSRFYEYKILPGSYKLNTSMTSIEILQKMQEEPEEGNEP